MRGVRPTLCPRLLLAQLVLTGLCALAPATGQAAAKRRALPADFLGVTSEDAFAGTNASRDKAFRNQAAAGVRLVRQPFRWAGIETTSGTYELGPYDRLSTAACCARWAAS